MTDASVETDRQRLAEAGAIALGPLLVRHVNNFIIDELSPPADNPLPASSLSVWRETLMATIGVELARLLFTNATGQWSRRGLPVPAEDAIVRDAALAVRRTIAGTDNLAQVLADAAAGKEGSASLEVLRGLTHQELVGSSLTMTGSDQLYDRFANGPGLTGRRRWVVANPETSRHGALAGEIAGRDRNFELGGKEITGPREDPADVAMWSNCSCSLEYELDDDEGTWA